MTPCGRIRWSAAVLAAAAAVTAGPAAGAGSSGLVRATTFGVQYVSAATADGRSLAIWSGEGRSASVLAAEHTPGRGSWAAVLLDPGEAGPVLETDVAADAAGDAVAVWAVIADVPSGSAIRVRGARRLGPARWSPAETLADLPGGLVGGLQSSRVADVEMTPGGGALLLMGAPDGSVTSRSLPAGSTAWGPAQVVRPAGPAPALGPDVALAVDGAGGAAALWTQGSGRDRSIGTADRRGGAWSAPAILPGSEGALQPAVVFTGNRFLAAFGGNVGIRAAARAPTGAWPRPSRVGAGVAPVLVAHGGTAALTWDGSPPGTAVLRAGARGWRPARPPVLARSVTVARDGALVIGGLTSGGALAWTRLSSGGRAWSRPRIVAGPAALAWPVALAPDPAGPLATLLWTSSVPREALRYADLRPGTGVRSGDEPRMRLASAAPARTAAQALVTLTPEFLRYTGPARVRVEVSYGGPWRAANTLQVDAGRPAEVRLSRPGAARLRLAYGPGLRRVTNAVRVTITRPAHARVVAGWAPSSIAARGRDLWVLSGVRGPADPQLRLLDARTGRLRRGPVTVPSGASLGETGGPVLIALPDASFRVLDPARPSLLGPRARLTAGTCTATCTPLVFGVGGATILPSRSVGPWTAPVTAPDGVIWGAGAVQTDGDGEPVSTGLLQVASGGAPLERGRIGPLEIRGASGELLGVPGGVWTRDARGGVTWFGASGPGRPRGDYVALAGARACVWGLSVSPTGVAAIDRLRQGSARPAVDRLVGAGLGDPAAAARLTVGPGTGWVIAPLEQTLVRVPLPAC